MLDTIIRGGIMLDNEKKRILLTGYDYEHPLKYCPFCGQTVNYMPLKELTDNNNSKKKEN